MKFIRQSVFLVVFAFAVNPSPVLPADGSVPAASKKETTNDFQHASASCSQMIQKARADEDFLRIGTTIERLPLAPRTDVAVWTQQRRVKLELWLKAIDMVDRSIHPTFDRRDVPASNVSRQWRLDLTQGLTPCAIKDPKLRQQYEKAIRDNNDKSDRYNLQHDSGQLDAEWPLRIRIYVRTEYTSEAEDVKEVSDLLDKLLSSSDRKKQLKKEFFGEKDAESQKNKQPSTHAGQATVDPKISVARPAKDSGK